MSGHHKFSGLLKEFTPELRQSFEAKNANLRAAIECEIYIPPITLDWSKWHRWDDVGRRLRDGGVNVPDRAGGYQVKFANEKDLLAIGKANSLRTRANVPWLKKTGWIRLVGSFVLTLRTPGYLLRTYAYVGPLRTVQPL